MASDRIHVARRGGSSTGIDQSPAGVALEALRTHRTAWVAGRLGAGAFRLRATPVPRHPQ